MLMEEENQVHNPGKLVNCDMCVGHVSHEYVRRPVGLQWGWGMLGVEFVQEREEICNVCACSNTGIWARTPGNRNGWRDLLKLG